MARTCCQFLRSVGQAGVRTHTSLTKARRWWKEVHECGGVMDDCKCKVRLWSLVSSLDHLGRQGDSQGAAQSHCSLLRRHVADDNGNATTEQSLMAVTSPFIVFAKGTTKQFTVSLCCPDREQTRSIAARLNLRVPDHHTKQCMKDSSQPERTCCSGKCSLAKPPCRCSPNSYCPRCKKRVMPRDPNSNLESCIRATRVALLFFFRLLCDFHLFLPSQQ